MDVDLVQGKPPTIHVTGEVDLGNVDKVVSAINTALPESPQGLIIDMSEVTYIDSAGIQAVISAYQRLRKVGGVLVLVLGNPDVKAIFALIHPELLPGFIVAGDIESARQVFAEPSV